MDIIDLYQWQFSHIQKGIDAADKGQFASNEDVQKVFQKWKALACRFEPSPTPPAT